MRKNFNRYTNKPTLFHTVCAYHALALRRCFAASSAQGEKTHDTRACAHQKKTESKGNPTPPLAPPRLVIPPPPAKKPGWPKARRKRAADVVPGASRRASKKLRMPSTARGPCVFHHQALTRSWEVALPSGGLGKKPITGVCRSTVAPEIYTRKRGKKGNGERQLIFHQS